MQFSLYSSVYASWIGVMAACMLVFSLGGNRLDHKMEYVPPKPRVC